MKHYHGPKVDCTLYSFAMLLDEEPEVLMQEIGHDGMDICWPQEIPPKCRRGFHIQEMIDCCIRRGFFLTPIELRPRGAPRQSARALKIYDDEDGRFLDYVMGRPGVLIGKSKNSQGHACAWNGELVFDPQGTKYPITDFSIREAWLLG